MDLQTEIWNRWSFLYGTQGKGPLPDLSLITAKRSAPANDDSVVYRKPSGKLIAFGWYGGKFSYLNWLLPLLPKCHHYYEPFAGSACVLLNREPSPVETYRRIDGEVANFSASPRQQRGPSLRKSASRRFRGRNFITASQKTCPGRSSDRRARLFYVRARQARTGLAQTASLGRWANCRNTSRAGMSGIVSRWLGAIEDLPHIAMRLMRVQIETDRQQKSCAFTTIATRCFLRPAYSTIHGQKGLGTR